MDNIADDFENWRYLARCIVMLAIADTVAKPKRNMYPSDWMHFAFAGTNGNVRFVETKEFWHSDAAELYCAIMDLGVEPREYYHRLVYERDVRNRAQKHRRALCCVDPCLENRGRWGNRESNQRRSNRGVVGHRNGR